MKSFSEKLSAVLGRKGDVPFNLSAGEQKEIEIAMPGEFVASGDKEVSLSADDLREIASSYEVVDGEEPLLKVGHEEVTTSTSDYGRVKSLRYDDEKRRLLAAVVPTEAGVEKVRKEGFKRVSMELVKRGGEWVFKHASLLAAMPPAIKGLEPVHFAAAKDGETLTLMQADEPVLNTDAEACVWFFGVSQAKRDAAAKSGAAFDDGSWPIQNADDLQKAMDSIGHASKSDSKHSPESVKAHIKKRAKALGLTGKLTKAFGGDAEDKKDNGADEDTEKMSQSRRREDAMSEQETAALAAANKDRERARTLHLSASVNAAHAFVEAHQKRIPLALMSNGFEALLASAYAARTGEEEDSVKFSAGEDKGEIKLDFAGALEFIIKKMPEQVTKTETTELANGGKNDEQPEFVLSGRAAGLGISEEGTEMLAATNEELASAKAKGETIDFASAARRAMNRRVAGVKK